MADGSGGSEQGFEVKTAPAELPAVGMSYNFDMGAGRQLVFQTHFPQDGTPHALHGLLDKLANAAAREVAKAMLPGAKKEVERGEGYIVQLTADLERLDTDAREKWDVGPKKGHYKPSPQTSATIRKAQEQIEIAQRDLVRWKAQVAEYEAKIGGMT